MEELKNCQAPRKYHQVKKWIFFAGLFWDIVLLVVFFFSGFSFVLKEFAQGFSSHSLWVNGFYILLLSIGMYILHFPLNYFEGYSWEHAFDLSNQTFFQWLADSIKKNLIGIALGVFVVEIVYVLLKFFNSMGFQKGDMLNLELDI